MVLIYVIELEKGKYYVGKTKNRINLEKRIIEHKSNNGSRWTEKYRFKRIKEVIEGCDEMDEDKYTIKYMGKYGIDNVRGGTFVKEELTNVEVELINRMINGAKDRCFKCGETGHFAIDCYYEESEDELEEWQCEKCGEEFLFKEECIKHERYCKRKKNNKYGECYKCGREGHWSRDCYARYDKNGYEI